MIKWKSYIKPSDSLCNFDEKLIQNRLANLPSQKERVKYLEECKEGFLYYIGNNPDMFLKFNKYPQAEIETREEEFENFFRLSNDYKSLNDRQKKNHEKNSKKIMDKIIYGGHYRFYFGYFGKKLTLPKTGLKYTGINEEDWAALEIEHFLTWIEEAIEYNKKLLAIEEKFGHSENNARELAGYSLRPIKWKKTVALLANFFDWLFENDYIEKGEKGETWALIAGHFKNPKGKILKADDYKIANSEVKCKGKKASAKGSDKLIKKICELEKDT
jgi:hypothetical protein